jgi:hypothetical protein
MRYYREDMPLLRVLTAGEDLLRRAHEFAQAIERRLHSAAGAPGPPKPDSEGGDPDPGKAPDRPGTPGG